MDSLFEQYPKFKLYVEKPETVFLSSMICAILHLRSKLNYPHMQDAFTETSLLIDQSMFDDCTDYKKLLDSLICILLVYIETLDINKEHKISFQKKIASYMDTGDTNSNE